MKTLANLLLKEKQKEFDQVTAWFITNYQPSTPPEEVRAWQDRSIEISAQIKLLKLLKHLCD